MAFDAGTAAGGAGAGTTTKDKKPSIPSTINPVILAKYQEKLNKSAFSCTAPPTALLKETDPRLAIGVGVYGQQLVAVSSLPKGVIIPYRGETVFRASDAPLAERIYDLQIPLEPKATTAANSGTVLLDGRHSIGGKAQHLPTETHLQHLYYVRSTVAIARANLKPKGYKTTDGHHGIGLEVIDSIDATAKSPCILGYNYGVQYWHEVKIAAGLYTPEGTIISPRDYCFIYPTLAKESPTSDRFALVTNGNPYNFLRYGGLPFNDSNPIVKIECASFSTEKLVEYIEHAEQRHIPFPLFNCQLLKAGLRYVYPKNKEGTVIVRDFEFEQLYTWEAIKEYYIDIDDVDFNLLTYNVSDSRDKLALFIEHILEIARNIYFGMQALTNKSPALGEAFNTKPLKSMKPEEVYHALAEFILKGILSDIQKHFIKGTSPANTAKLKLIGDRCLDKLGELSLSLAASKATATAAGGAGASSSGTIAAPSASAVAVTTTTATTPSLPEATATAAATKPPAPSWSTIFHSCLTALCCSRRAHRSNDGAGVKIE